MEFLSTLVTSEREMDAAPPHVPSLPASQRECKIASGVPQSFTNHLTISSAKGGSSPFFENNDGQALPPLLRLFDS